MAIIDRRMATDLASLTIEATCREAAGMMRERHIGAVAVKEAGRIIGLIAERDLALRVVGEGASPDTKLSAVVRRNEPSVLPSATEKECIDLMRERNVRHLLVRDSSNAVVGLISMRDVIMLMVDEKEFVIGQLEDYISGR